MENLLQKRKERLLKWLLVFSMSFSNLMVTTKTAKVYAVDPGTSIEYHINGIDDQQMRYATVSEDGTLTFKPETVKPTGLDQSFQYDHHIVGWTMANQNGEDVGETLWGTSPIASQEFLTAWEALASKEGGYYLNPTFQKILPITWKADFDTSDTSIFPSYIEQGYDEKTKTLESITTLTLPSFTQQEGFKDTWNQQSGSYDIYWQYYDDEEALVLTYTGTLVEKGYVSLEFTNYDGSWTLPTLTLPDGVSAVGDANVDANQKSITQLLKLPTTKDYLTIELPTGIVSNKNREIISWCNQITGCNGIKTVSVNGLEAGQQFTHKPEWGIIIPVTKYAKTDSNDETSLGTLLGSGEPLTVGENDLNLTLETYLENYRYDASEPGYVFAYWQDDTGKRINSNSGSTPLERGVKANAVFTPSTNINTITYDPKGGIIDDSTLKKEAEDYYGGPIYKGEFETDKLPSLPTPTKEHYVFKGWQMGYDGDIVTELTLDNIADFWSSWESYYDVTLEAVWQGEPYELTLPDASSQVAYTIEVDEDNSAIEYGGSAHLILTINDGYALSKTVSTPIVSEQNNMSISIEVDEDTPNTYDITLSNITGDSVILVNPASFMYPYQVTFVDSEGDPIPGTSSIDELMNYEEEYSITPPTIAGYRVRQMSFTGTMNDSFKPIQVVYDLIPFNVILNMDGGEVSDEGWTSDLGQYQKQHNVKTAVELPTSISKEGYSFTGWYSASERTESSKLASYTIPVGTANNTEVYAGWTINQYQVDFNTNGHGTLASTTLEHGSVLSEADYSLFDKGYQFLGWYEDALLTKPFTLDKTPVTKDMTLYAKWEAESFTLELPSNPIGYELIPSTTTLDYESTLTFILDVKEGYSVSSPFLMLNGGNSIEFKESNDQYSCTLSIKEYYDVLVKESNTLVVEAVGVSDQIAPTISIKVGNSVWENIVNVLSFGLFFKDTTKLTIEAKDAGSGINTIDYIIVHQSDLPQDGIYDYMRASNWLTYDSDGVELAPNGQSLSQMVVYARVTDKAGNTVYASSDGLVLDSIAPISNELFDGFVYEDQVTFTTRDELEVVVKDNGTLLEVNTDGQYVIEANHDAIDHEIVLVDQAGNETTYHIQVLDQHTLTYVMNGGAIFGEPDYSVTIYHGYSIFDNVSVATSDMDPVKSGYRFDGFYYDENFRVEVSEGSNQDALVDDSSVYAKWVIEDYQILFRLNGDNDDVILESNNDFTLESVDGIYTTSYQIGNDGKLPEPIREGYDFDGWYYVDLDTDEELPLTFDETTCGDLDLTAHWTIKTYNVTFVDPTHQKVTTEQSTQVVNHNDKATSFNLTQTGYTFDGWKDQNGQLFDFNTPIISNLELTASWTLNTYTITFNHQGHGDSQESIKVNYGQTIEVLPELKEVGYTFNGWFSDASCKNAFDLKTVITDNLTLYAGWTINTYTVTFNTLKEGVDVTSQSITYLQKATLPTSPSLTGYSFEGWYKEETLENSYDFNTEVTQDITLYAKWNKNNYTVTFNINGHGSAIEAQTVPYLEAITVPTTPTATGYTFTGWYSEEACTHQVDLEKVMVNANVTYFAGWTLNQYAINLHSDVGELPELGLIDHGALLDQADIELLNTNAYVFEGWYDDEAGKQAHDFTLPVTSDLDLYAIWSIRTYNVYLPEVMEGYVVSVSKENPVYEEDISITFKLAEGYDKSDHFALFINDQEIPLEADDTCKITVLEDVTLNVMGVEDITAPNVTITVNENSWKALLNSLTFGLFFKDTLEASIEASDNGSGVDTIQYAISNEAVEDVTTLEWLDYEAAFSIVDDGQYVIYAKATDNATNSQIINTEGLVLDNIAPVIRGAQNNQVYYGEVVITVEDQYEGLILTDNGKEVNLVDHQYTISPDNQEHVLVLTDQAGNSSTITITVNGIYTVTFEQEKIGEAVESQNVKYLETVTSPGNLDAVGYIFEGWFIDDTYQTAFDFENTKITADTTIYGHWSVATYSVTFDINGHGSEIDPMVVAYGQTIEALPENEAEGYSFEGWYEDEACTKAFDVTTAITTDSVLYAKWTINTYTVTFNTLKEGVNVTSQTITYLQKATLPTSPTLTGYSFEGWYEDDALENQYDFNTEVIQDITLYAKWNKNNYTVTFDMNGHGNSVASQTIAYQDQVTTPSEPTTTGYVFEGWYQDAALSTIFDFTMPIEADTTIYAKWQVASYIVSFDTNGHQEVASQSVDYLGYALEPTDISDTGYIFEGWFSDATLENPFDFRTPITMDTTIYASWTAIQYVVSFDMNGHGTSIDDVLVDYSKTIEVPETPVAIGYTFDGWYLEDTPYNFEDGITQDVTLKAKWTLNNYDLTVSYQDEAGKPLMEASVVAYPYDSTYETKALEFEGYELVTTPSNATGKMTVNGESVTYVYKKLVFDLTLPKTMEGYVVSASSQQIAYGEGVSLTFTLMEGYDAPALRILANDEVLESPDGKTYVIDNVTSNITIKVEGVVDMTAPSASIQVKDSFFSSLLETITFGLFFNESQKVTITAEDQGSGISNVSYLLATVEMSEEELYHLTEDAWTLYEAPFMIDPNHQWIIYAKVQDNAGNTTYISTNGLVLDNIAPVVTGLEDGTTLSGNLSFSVLGEDEITVLDNQKTINAIEGIYTILDDGQEHFIEIVDRAGNRLSYTVNFERPIQNTTTLTLSLAGGSGVGEGSFTFEQAEGQTNFTFTIPANTPTREGYDFEGWFSSYDGSIHQPGETLSFTYGVTPNIVVEARWVQIIEAGTLYLVSGNAYRLPAGGWYLASDGTYYPGGYDFYVSADGYYTFERGGE